METKIIKKRSGKYKNDNERITGRRKTRRKSHHKCKPKKSNVKSLYGNFNDRYRSGLFRFLITKDYYFFITLTHKGKVTLNQHETIVNKILQKIRGKGYVNFYFKVNEWDYINYHSHILVEGTDKVKDIVGVFKRYWKEYGNADISRLETLPDKYKATDYCLKQLKPLDRRHTIQELIDTWDYYEAPLPVIEADIFRNEAFLASVWHERDYIYQRPAGSLLIPGMTLNEAFSRIQAKMDNQNVSPKNLVAIYI